MSYLDERDWRGSDEQVRDVLSEICARCPHYRYLHGKAWKDTDKPLEYKPGRCTIDQCKCGDFLESPPISTEDILDLHDILRGGVHPGRAPRDPLESKILTGPLVPGDT